MERAVDTGNAVGGKKVNIKQKLKLLLIAAVIAAISLCIIFPVSDYVADAYVKAKYADTDDEMTTESITILSQETEPYSEDTSAADITTFNSVEIEAFEQTTEPTVDLYSLPDEVINTLSRTDIIKYSQTTESTTEPKSIPRYILTEYEKRLISVTAWNADFSSDESLLCIIKVIKNRVESSKSKYDTVEEILRQKNQFEPCDRILYNKKNYDFTRIEKLINKIWYEDYDPFDGANVLFYSAIYVNPNRISKNLRLVKTVGGSNFYAQD